MKNVGLLMGSQSDLDTLKFTINILEEFTINFETQIVSAHRTPDKMFEYAKTAEKRGLQLIIAGAGGAAHLPGMVASLTNLPVIGVPIKSKILNGIDSLLSIVQMPSGVPVATVAIGEAGAINAALLAVRILALSNIKLKNKLNKYINDQTQKIINSGEKLKY